MGDNVEVTLDEKRKSAIDKITSIVEGVDTPEEAILWAIDKAIQIIHLSMVDIIVSGVTERNKRGPIIFGPEPAPEIIRPPIIFEPEPAPQADKWPPVIFEPEISAEMLDRPKLLDFSATIAKVVRDLEDSGNDSALFNLGLEESSKDLDKSFKYFQFRQSRWSDKGGSEDLGGIGGLK